MINFSPSRRHGNQLSTLTTGIICILLASCSTGHLRSQENDQTTRRVVIAKEDIQEGSDIHIEALEEKEIPTNKIPQDTLTSASLAAGQIAKYGIQTGQIISQHDLLAERTHSIYLKLKKNEIQQLRRLAHKQETTVSELTAEMIEKRLSRLSKAKH